MFYKTTPRTRLSRRLAAWALALAGALPSFAATQTVTNTNNNGAGSLRQAIAAANAGDTIQFAPGVTGTILLTSDELVITKNLTITGPSAASVAVSGNNATRVFRIEPGATVIISGLTIENGNAVAFGGVGGGINNRGTLTLTNSTVSGNSAITGGGIYNPGTLTLTNSTVSGNSASESGGGIDNDIIGTLTLTNSTVSGNSAPVGGGIDNESGALIMKSTLLASNRGGNCHLLGSPTSQGYNLSDDASCSSTFTATGDRNTTAAGLDPKGLQNNGGPTPTIALLPTSPAVDAIPVANCTDTSGQPVVADQRDISRPQGDGCDIGAFELVQTVPFSSFSAKLEVLTGKVSGFNLDARFTLGSNSQGIKPLTEAVTLTVGSYNVTLPAGSFHQVQVGPYSDYAYVGTINKVRLDVQIVPLGGNGYALQAAAVPVTLTGAMNSVTITLTVGQDTGTTTVTPIILRR